MLSGRGGRIALLALLALASGTGLWYSGGTRSPTVPRSPAPARSPEPSPAERLAILEKSLRAVRDGERDAPRDRWDPAYVVAHLGRSPDTLRKWVQENTSWIPYRGVLRGPVGVLMDRQGNSLDRAVLLARLLAEAGHAVRLAHAELSAEWALDELPGLAARRAGIALDEWAAAGQPAAPIRETADQYGLDGPAIERTLGAYKEATARLLTDLDRRVMGQTARLLSAVSGPDPAEEWRTRRDTALAALRDHWWVQVRRGESWMDLDLLGSSGGEADTTPLAPLETMPSSEITPSLFHEIVLRVVEERLTRGTLAEHRTLEHILRPSELIGRPVALQFWPTSWPNGPLSSDDPGRLTRRLALEQEEWSTALMIGSDVVAKAVLGASASPQAGASGLMKGLGGAIAEGLRPAGQSGRDGQDSLLTAVWIEYQLNVPGRKPEVLRRRIVDLIGPAARDTWPPGRMLTLDQGQRLTRSLSLMMRTEILPVVTQLAPEFVLHVHGRSLIANADLLRAVALPGFGSDEGAARSLLRQAEPGVSPLHTLALLRKAALGGLGFIDRPSILTRHLYPTARGEDIALEDATDIVANEVGIALTVHEGFAARVTQGVWDTNLEGLLGPGSRLAANTALAYAASSDWRVLTSAHQDRPVSGLPPDAAALLHRQLDSGYTVVAPDAPVEFDGEEFVGWWRIHPETGDALGIAGNGWGQAAPGYGMHLAAFVEMAKPYVFTYALCQYIPQAANSLNIIGGEFWARGLAPSWTRPPEPGKDFEEVAAENNRKCVIEAILAGFVATAPLLMKTLMYRTEAELANEVKLLKGKPKVTLPSIATPAGASPKPKGYPAPSGPPAPKAGPAGTLPGGAKPPADPLGKTEPGLPKTEPALPKTQPALPKTKPGPPPVPTKAGPPPTPKPAPAPANPNPLSEAEARENAKKAAEARAAAGRAASEATSDFVRYRASKPNPGRGHPGDPANWDPKVDAELQENMWRKQQENIDRIHDWRVAEKTHRDAKAAARGAQGRGGLQPARPAPEAAPAPNFPGCPPNCGNANPTGPAGEVQVSGSPPGGALEVGSAGAASSLSSGAGQ